MSYEIRKGVPIPPARCKWRKWEYPFEGMESGDSFFVSGEELMQRYSAQMQTAVATAASQYGKRHGRRYVTRLEISEDGIVRGVRVWREK